MKIKKTLCLLLVGACALLCACDSGKTTDKYYEYEYEASHESDSRILSFYSSDDDLDYVLNDYLERHMRYNEETQIHNFPIGEGRSDWKEWEAMAASFWDASAANGTLPSTYATKDIVTRWLQNPNIDSQGYVMPDSGGANSWGLGWEFPAGSPTYEFSSDNEGWTVGENSFMSVSNSKITATATSASEITIESPYIGKIAVAMPFVKITFGINVTNPSAIDDLYIYFKTDKDDEYDEDKVVKFSTFCLQGFSLYYAGAGTMYEGFLPMYTHSAYGKESNEITGLKFVLKAKEGEKLNGSLIFDQVAGDYDDRHIINVCNYIIAAKDILSFSQDESLLATVMPNARKAMNFLYYQLKGQSGLISTEYLVGHDNRMLQVSYGLGDGYWDVSSFPDVNAYCNISYYNALKAMLYLERMSEEYNVSVSDVFTQNEDLSGRYKYALTIEDLEELTEKCKSEFESYFWNENTGRFHVGIRSINNSMQDNGYLMFNQQAIAAGLGTEEQVKSIMSWINGERTVAGDLSSGEDIYYYEFAPRFCTAELSPDVYWSGIGAFGTNVNNGGTALQLAYYDFVSQSMTNVNRAGERLQTFVNWYKKVAAAGGEGWEFYRKYYQPTGIMLQGGGSGGVIGLDYEFLEAAIVIRAIPDSFFGLDPIENKTLSVTPNLPDSLDFMKMENLTYAGRYYDLSVGHYFAQVSGIANCGTPVDGASLQFVFEEPDFKYKVYADDVEINNYIIKDGKLYVTCDFSNIKIEIKKV